MIEFDGNVGQFIIDTGSFGGLLFNSPAVKKYGLLKDSQATARQQRHGGGGDTLSRASTTLDYFIFAGKRWEDQSVTLVTSDTGVFARPDLAGMVGHDYLKHYRFVLDYSNDRIGFIAKE